MTLDDCKIAPSDESTVTQAVPQELASNEPNVLTDTSETPSLAFVPDPSPSAAPQVAPSPRARRATLAPDAGQPPPTVVAPTDRQNSMAPAGLSKGQVPYGFYALLVLSGAVASSIFSRLLSPAIRVPRPPVHENTPEERKAALHALLLKSQRRK